LLNSARNLLRDDEIVVILGKVQPDRFSGGLRLNVMQIWDLPSARCRFGKYLKLTVNGSKPEIARILKDHPAKIELTDQGEMLRGLQIRLCLLREKVSAEVQLGPKAKFFPSDAALASWMAQVHEGQIQIVYD